MKEQAPGDHSKKHMIKKMEDIHLVRTSPHFDQDWYLARYPDVALSGIDPALHYLRFGVLLERDPGPEFSTADYLREHPSCRDGRINPLVHLKRMELCGGQAAAAGRVAVFAAFSGDGVVSERVLHYLKGLRAVVGRVVAVYDNELGDDEKDKLAGLSDHVIAARHNEYDFGSYKRGVRWLQDAGYLADASQLILCNDSCYGPLESFVPMVSDMDARGYDVWGMTDSHEFSYHLQSYFVSLSRRAFTSAAFWNFIASIERQSSVSDVVLKYELGLTKVLVDAGFSAGAYIRNEMTGVHEKDNSCQNIAIFPLYSIRKGAPLLKVKALRHPRCNMDGINATLVWLKENSPRIYEIATADLDVVRYLDSGDVAFSVILPTHNRAWCIRQSLDSMLAQAHSNFEIIIVDDGSEDGTEDLIRTVYADEIRSGKLRYFRIEENVGVCRARNVGLSMARNPWIAYLDSDNQVRPYFLSVFAESIVENRDKSCFYAKFIHVQTGKIVGVPFDYSRLKKANFIDLGVFVHRRDLVVSFGGFDPGLRRLVDWEFILRMTRPSEPIFIPRILMDYSDAEDDGRITRKESYHLAATSVLSRHGDLPVVTTAIVSYNHSKYIAEAIESALSQKGRMVHEILVSDDGSTDGTGEIIEKYARQYPGRIRNISRGGNFGVSDNYRHCFSSASGNFVAILEGDDVWIDPEKNAQQAEFLRAHPEAAMVFSKIELFNETTGKKRLLDRQRSLGTGLLSAKEFSEDQNLNLIANFSSTMFRREILVDLPSVVYEPRISEIAVAFYIDRIGKKIGIIDKVMGTYRINPQSVWQGATKRSKLEQSIAVRESALCVAASAYKPVIARDIAKRRDELASCP